MTCSEQIRAAALIIKKESSILIGAGAGLSAAAGLSFGGGEQFKERFGDFADRYGITDEYTGGFYPFATPEEFWAWWSRSAYYNRYAAQAGQPYKDLRALVQGKDYFVITTNVDSQFVKAGFEPNRVFETQGDFGLFQCAAPCTRATYGNEEQIRAMFEAQEDMKIPSELIPVCPSCGGPMTMNLRIDSRFVEDAAWARAAEAYTGFLRRHRGRPLVLMEIGVGYNTPQIIKYAFWQMTYENPRATYIVVNPVDAVFPKEIENRAIAIEESADTALAQMLQYGNEAGDNDETG